MSGNQINDIVDDIRHEIRSYLIRETVITNGERGAASFRASPDKMESVMTSKPQTVTTSPDKMETSVTDTSPAPSERHARTGALETNTPEVTPSHKPPTVAQVLAQQNAEPSAPLPPAPRKEILPPVRMASEEAFERNLAQLSNGPVLGTMINFNGQTGVYRVISDNTEIAMDSEYLGLLSLTRHGWIKFGDENNPTVTDDYCISEPDGMLKPRKDLGDLDQTKWPLDFDGKAPQDPWQQRYLVVLQDLTVSGELFTFSALGKAPPINSYAINAVETLLQGWRYNPGRKNGMLPIIRLGKYVKIDKKHNNARRPVPSLRIVRLLNPDGSPINGQQKHDELQDKIPF
jgi:hypothetical protein